MSDYVNQFDWGFMMEDDVDKIDWTTLKEEIMNGPFGELWDDVVEEEEEGGAGVDGGDSHCQLLPHTDTFHAEIATTTTVDAVGPSFMTKPQPVKSFQCATEGCGKSFKRRSDLNRHAKKHGFSKKFDCTAIYCDRKGERGFTRLDKLSDHILAGHDDETSFKCPHCDEIVTRDLMSIHTARRDEWDNMAYYRTCPMPRCSLKVHFNNFGRTELYSQVANRLQAHLVEKHPLQGRRNFADLLERSGYNAETGYFICPACPSKTRLQDLADFEKHFFEVHLQSPACGDHADASCEERCWGRTPLKRLQACTAIPIEVHEHRRQILRIWPAFHVYSDWADLRCRN